MQLKGFIGGAYKLDSVNVDAQRCVNLYPEMIQSGTGKEGGIAYLRATPGTEVLKEIGNGPIRLLHRDVTGRIFVVSGNQLFVLTHHDQWRLSFIPTDYNSIFNIVQSTAVNTATDEVTSNSNGYYTGLKARVSSSGTLPTGLAASTDYWLIRVDDNKFKFASNLADAIAGTAIDLSAVGSGNMNIYPQLPVLTDVAYSAVNPTTDTISKTAHGLYTGLKIQIYSTGAITGSIQFLTDYFVIATDADNFKIASSLANAVANIAFDITAIDGSTEEWNAVLCGANGQDGGSAITFATSTGPIRAASSSSAFENIPGATNPTLFMDGSDFAYLYYDWPQSNSLLTAPPTLYAPRGFAISSSTFQSSHIEWVDGYFVVNEVGSNKFWVSNLNSINIDGLSFASAEGSPDLIMGLIVNSRDLWILNERTTEIYVNTGNADFPFERVQSGFIEIGCAAKYSIAKIDGKNFWLGRSESGQGAVYAAQGMNPQRISTHAIEQAISGYSDISTATAFTYNKNGHDFYVLNFAEATWVFDLNTGLWHERAYTNDGSLLRHRAEVHLYEPGTGLHLVGDFSDNRVYSLADGVYTDDGDAITRLRSSPHISSDTKQIFYSRFQLDMEVGVGLVSGLGSDPQVMLDWSDDGGHTWSDETWTSAGGQVGGIGEFKKRVLWRRLGKSRDRIYRVTITDPVKVALIGAHIEFTVGAS